MRFRSQPAFRSSSIKVSTILIPNTDGVGQTDVTATLVFVPRSRFLILAGLVLTVCGDRAEPASDEPVALPRQDWQTNRFRPVARETLSQFHESNPSVTEFYTPDSDNIAETLW